MEIHDKCEQITCKRNDKLNKTVSDHPVYMIWYQYTHVRQEECYLVGPYAHCRQKNITKVNK